MTEALDRAVAQQADVPDASEAVDRAWYLYGIIRAPRSHQEQRGDCQSNTEARLDSLTIDGIPLQLVEQGDLAAVVKPVSGHEFKEESLQERLSDPAILEAMARAHNEVIARIHHQQAILPAKFGSVYARLEDVRQALEPMNDALRARLDRLEGSDEWAVHVYADRTIVQQRIVGETSSIRQLREDLKTARPGRGYFLQRKLATELVKETDETLDELAQEGFDQLRRSAVAGQVSPAPRSDGSDTGPIEILHASFLVRRTGVDAFMRVVESFAADHEGVSFDYSGPWPPYSFAGEEQL